MIVVSTHVVVVVAALLPTNISQSPGTVTTVATASTILRHVIMDPQDGTLYFTQDHSVNRILMGSTTAERLAGSDSIAGASNGIGTAAFFNTPVGIAQGLRNRSLLYVADNFNNCLRAVHIPSRTVSTLAGLCNPAVNGTTDATGALARFFGPRGLAMALVRNSSGSATAAVEVLYVSDRDNNRIRRVDVVTGQVSTFALSGDTTSFKPVDIAVVLDVTTVNATEGGSGVLKWLLVADLSDVVRLVNATSDASGVMTTLAGNGTTGYQDGEGNIAMFYDPNGIAAVDVDPTNTSRGIVAYVTDFGNCAIRQVTMAGVVTTVSGGGPAIRCSGTSLVDGSFGDARFFNPFGVRFYSLRNGSGGREFGLFVGDRGNKVVRRMALNSSTYHTATASTSSALSLTASSLSSTTSTSYSLTSDSSPSVSGSWSLPTESPSNTSDMPSISIGEPTPTTTHSICCTTTSGHSATVSPSSWHCGAIDVRNASLGAPDYRIIALTAKGTGGARVLVLQPSEHPALHRPLTEAASVLEAMAVPRVALLWTASEPVPLLMVRLPAAWANTPRWYVASARSLLHGNATLDFIEDRATASPRTVTLHAPQSSRLGWLPRSVVMTEATWIMVALDLACAAEGGNVTGRTTTVVIAIPAPGVTPALSQAVATATTVTQWTTAVGGPGSGSAVGRVGAVRSIMLCGNDDDRGPSGGGLLGTAFRVDNPACAGSSSSASARGAVVGNGGIVVFGAVVAGLSTVAYAAVRRGGSVDAFNLRAASLRLGVPSVLLPMWIATLSSTSAGSVELMLGGSSATRAPCAVDIVLGLLGSLMCIAPVVWICYVSFLLVPRLGLQIVDRVRGPLPSVTATHLPSSGTVTTPSVVFVAVREAFARRVEWVAQKKKTTDCNGAQRDEAEDHNFTEDQMADTHMDVGVTLEHEVEDKLTSPSNDTSAERSAATSHASRQAQVLLHEFRVLPYAAIDVGVLVVSGVLSAISGVGSHGVCVGAGSAIAVMYGLQLAVCAVGRPFTSTFAHVHALMTLALSCTSVGLQVGAMTAATGSDAASLGTMNDLTVAAAACDLCVIGISAVRVLVDSTDFFKAVRRLLEDLRTRSSFTVSAASLPQGDTTLGASVHTVPTHSVASMLRLPPVPLGSEEFRATNDNSFVVDDTLFWDADGYAICRAQSLAEGVLDDLLAVHPMRKRRGELGTGVLFDL